MSANEGTTSRPRTFRDCLSGEVIGVDPEKVASENNLSPQKNTRWGAAIQPNWIIAVYFFSRAEAGTAAALPGPAPGADAVTS